MNFVRIMNSAAGRIGRVVAGLALIGIGAAIGGPGGIVLAVVGLVPLAAGVAGACLAAPLLGAAPRAH